MTITQKDSQLINTSLTTPTVSANLINNFEGELDKNVLDIFKAIVRDIDDFKSSLNGITRQAQYDNMLFIYNQPNQRQTNIQEALRMDKYGHFAIGTEYPRWDRCLVDVNGPLYAVPQYGLWAQDTIIAGVGTYRWTVEVFNPNSDIYTRAAANIGIVISEPGVYEIKPNVFASDAAAATGARITWNILQNGTIVATFANSLFADDLSWAHCTKLLNVSRGDTIAINLNAPATANRYGDATLTATWLQICKVN